MTPPAPASSWRRSSGRTATADAWQFGDRIADQAITVADLQDDVEPRVFSDVQAMLDAGIVDAVDITTEVGVHHTQALACLEAGAHALVEKPLAITVRAARQMVEEAERRGLQLAVSENARFNRGIRLAHWLMRRGDLGVPQMVSWMSIGTELWSPDRWVGHSSWRHRKLIGAGGLLAGHRTARLPPAARALRRG